MPRPRSSAGTGLTGSTPWCWAGTSGPPPALRDDARLEKYLAKATGRFLTVPDPRLAVLRDIPRAFLAIRIRLTEPESDGRGPGLTK